MTFGSRLRELRLDKGLTQSELAKMLSLGESTISFYEADKREPDYYTLQRIANFFRVSTDYLFGRTDKPLPPDMTSQIPILGNIRAGIPLLTEENYEGELDIPADIKADFALQVKGESMIGVGIHEGDYALCRESQIVHSGDIVVALHDNASGFSEATLKYFFRDSKKGDILRAANPDFEDIVMDESYRIGGIMVALLKKEPPPYWHFTNYLSTRDITLKEWDSVIQKAIQYGITPAQLKEIIDIQWNMMQKFMRK
ncbi:hypothetical protein E308F_25410 [Moorella sp. E308F]|uniref:LexA family protein n=1 Tax=Moorella sp. E308F TaxID=2572682 RepID=UPI0010FFB4E1|nr:S24 family peptidase [Moorella sp. E308F]GEA16297.1 hypothetical protein E308F_25410 [Moorella sp. E308F]